jgi:class 3 adenylate cyclase
MEFVTNEKNSDDGLTHFDIRIGIHTGPVVAGIVGIKKWQYDIWGDTVNIASRMESMSEPGHINLSETTYQQIKDKFPCEYRGEIEAKNRGLLKMYYLI